MYQRCSTVRKASQYRRGEKPSAGLSPEPSVQRLAAPCRSRSEAPPPVPGSPGRPVPDPPGPRDVPARGEAAIRLRCLVSPIPERPELWGSSSRLERAVVPVWRAPPACKGTARSPFFLADLRMECRSQRGDSPFPFSVMMRPAVLRGLPGGPEGAGSWQGTRKGHPRPAGDPLRQCLQRFLRQRNVPA